MLTPDAEAFALSFFEQMEKAAQPPYEYDANDRRRRLGGDPLVRDIPPYDSAPGNMSLPGGEFQLPPQPQFPIDPRIWRAFGGNLQDPRYIQAMQNRMSDAVIPHEEAARRAAAATTPEEHEQAYGDVVREGSRWERGRTVDPLEGRGGIAPDPSMAPKVSPEVAADRAARARAHEERLGARGMIEGAVGGAEPPSPQGSVGPDYGAAAPGGTQREQMREYLTRLHSGQVRGVPAPTPESEAAQAHRANIAARLHASNWDMNRYTRPVGGRAPDDPVVQRTVPERLRQNLERHGDTLGEELEARHRRQNPVDDLGRPAVADASAGSESASTGTPPAQGDPSRQAPRAGGGVPEGAGLEGRRQGSGGPSYTPEQKAQQAYDRETDQQVDRLQQGLQARGKEDRINQLAGQLRQQHQGQMKQWRAGQPIYQSAMDIGEGHHGTYRDSTSGQQRPYTTPQGDPRGTKQQFQQAWQQRYGDQAPMSADLAYNLARAGKLQQGLTDATKPRTASGISHASYAANQRSARARNRPGARAQNAAYSGTQTQKPQSSSAPAKDIAAKRVTPKGPPGTAYNKK